jgi:hypothetical protein
MVFGTSPLITPPYPALPSPVILIIEQAICVGLNNVKNRHQNHINAASETEITTWLSEELVLMWQDGSVVVGFDPNTYQLPHLDATLTNYDGSSHSVRPDLRFYMQRGVSSCVVDAPYQQAWFCECKLLEADHSSRNLSSYVNSGIQRFETGQYAWAMPHAQMLAYVREPRHAHYVPAQHLTPLLDGLGVIQKLDGAVLCSTHGRTFTLLNGKHPGAIELRHLWFKLQ